MEELQKRRGSEVFPKNSIGHVSDGMMSGVVSKMTGRSALLKISGLLALLLAQPDSLLLAEAGEADFTKGAAAPASDQASVPVREVIIPKWPEIERERMNTDPQYCYFWEWKNEKAIRWRFEQPDTSGRLLEAVGGKLRVTGGWILELVIDSDNNTDLGEFAKLDPVAVQALTVPLIHKIDSGAMPNIGKLTGLRILNLGGMKIKAEDLVHLIPLKSLTTLNLDDCPLDDVAIEHLLRFKSLKELSLYDTDLTPQGAERLRHGLPGCRIWSGKSQAVEEAGFCNWEDDEE